jgi:hypothetical protein
MSTDMKDEGQGAHEEVRRYQRAFRVMKVGQWMAGATFTLLVLAIVSRMNSVVLALGVSTALWTGARLILERWWKPRQAHYLSWWLQERKKVIKMVVIDEETAQRIEDVLKSFDRLPRADRPKA